ncbi:hypothetical protein [Streptomyces prunicolor]
MPIIDVYAPADLFPADSDRALADQLATAVMSAEGYPPPAPPGVKEITGVYLHRLPAVSVQTAATALARTVRVQILTFPDALGDAEQLTLMAEITRIVTDLSGDPTQRERTFVLITEAVSGGWGVGGVRPTAATLGLG